MVEVQALKEEVKKLHHKAVEAEEMKKEAEGLKAKLL